MKLIFETNGGNQFEMEVGNSDRLQEIKEKVEKNKGIPISKQTLSFNGNLLRDDLDILNSIIFNGSRIHLQIAADNPPEMHDSDIQFPLSPPKMNDSDFLDQHPIAADAVNHPPPQDIFLTFKMPAPFNTVNLDVDVNETIQQLKEKIQEMAIGRIVIKNENGMELPDHFTLLQFQISEKSDVTVEFLLAPRKLTLSSSQAAENKMGVVLKYGEERMPVEVRAAHKVSQLRTKLDKMNLEIPEAYFLVHSQDVIDEELSFTLQNVAQGDVIEIFEGRLSPNMSFQLKTGNPKTII